MNRTRILLAGAAASTVGVALGAQRAAAAGYTTTAVVLGCAALVLLVLIGREFLRARRS